MILKHDPVTVLIGFFIIVFLSGLIYTTYWMMRSSDKFWRAANELEDKIHAASSLQEVDSLYYNDFKALRKLALGNPHASKLNYLYGLLKGKHDAYEAANKQQHN